MQDFRCKAKAHALEEAPKEACGVLGNNTYYPCRNSADSPDEDSYRRAKAKTNGHSKKDAAKQIQRQSSGVVSHELWYNPSRDESLSPLQRDSKRRNM